MAGYIGTQAVSVNTTSATITGDASIGGDLSLGDSDKAIFGAGSDLQIYHDGSNSYVDDAGTGRLILRGNDRVMIQKYTGEDMISCLVDGAVKLYHNNAKKFETSASGITVLGNIANASGDMALDTAGDFIIDCAGSITLDSDGGDVQFKDGGVSIGAVINNNSDFVFRSLVSDKDVLIKGNDGGSTITALTLDMSLAGEAVFNAGAVVNESGIDSNFRVEGVSNTTMLFVDAGTDRVAIGHGTPHAKLDVMGQGTAIDNLSMLIGADEGNAVNPGRTNGADKACRIGVPHRDTSEQAMALIVASSTGSTTKNNITIGGGTGVLNGATEIHFNISDDATTTNGTLRMSIAQAGLVSIGTVPAVGGQLNLKATGDRCVSTMQVNANGDGAICFFNAIGTGVGNVLVNSSSVTYGTSSDYRLKENVDYDWDATTRLKQLKPARFNFISDADTTVDGFLAHEAQAVVPESVQGTHNETQTLANVVLSASNTVLAENIEQSDWTAGKSATTDEDGNAVAAVYPSDSTWAAEHVVPKMQGIDQSKLVPLLVKTIIELEARITALEA